MHFSETPSAQELKLLLEKARQNGMDDNVLERLGAILHFAESAYSISETCRVFGISRSTFHRWIERFDPENLESLEDRPHDPTNVRQSAISQETIELIRRYRMRYPLMGKERIAEYLRSEQALEISPSAIGRIIERECFFFADTPLHWKKRMDQQRENGGRKLMPEEEMLSSVQIKPVKLMDNEHPAFETRPSQENVVAGNVSRSTAAWRIVRKVMLISSVVTNIAFIAMLLGTLVWERAVESGQVLHAAPSAVESADSNVLRVAPSSAPMP